MTGTQNRRAVTLVSERQCFRPENKVARGDATASHMPSSSNIILGWSQRAMETSPRVYMVSFLRTDVVKGGNTLPFSRINLQTAAS